MKKKSNSRFARVLGRIFNIRTWFDWERMKVFTLYVGHALKNLFMIDTGDTKKKPVENLPLTESFASAQRSFKLSEADLLIQQKSLFRLSLLMAFIALLIFIYSFYHFIYGTVLAGLISLVVMMIALALSFRYHFWYYQIKTRQLGCSISEWFKKGLLGEKE